MAPSTFRAVFRMLVESKWVPLADLEGLEQEVVDDVLRHAQVGCCSFQGGFFIEVNGVTFSDEASVDELWMTWSWFFALRKLLDGAEAAEAGPWEESRLQLWRRGEVLAMEDRSAGGRVLTPRVEVELLPFAQSLARQGRELLALSDRLLGVLDAREPPVPAPVRQAFVDAFNLPRDVVEEVAAKAGL
jgi:hypothetical protein